jgi:hypothetical protein
VLLGFIGFYTIWEMKPRYIYLIYPYLILTAYYGLTQVSDWLKSLGKRILKLPEESDETKVRNNKTPGTAP